MLDFRMYAATKDNAGGPIFLEEEHSPLSPHYLANNTVMDDRPLTLGRAIGGVIALVLLIGTGAYLFIAL
jgi:hypothetical protein